MDSSDWTHIRTDTTTAYQFRENVLEEEKKGGSCLGCHGKKRKEKTLVINYSPFSLKLISQIVIMKNDQDF